MNNKKYILLIFTDGYQQHSFTKSIPLILHKATYDISYFYSYKNVRFACCLESALPSINQHLFYKKIKIKDHTVASFLKEVDIDLITSIIFELRNNVFDKHKVEDTGRLIDLDEDLTIKRIKKDIEREKNINKECDDDDNTCCVCYERERTIILLPCSHMCLCSTCSMKLKDKICPLCRKEITDFILPIK